ncbi:MAG: rhomboid family intramembrane serine protease [Bacteroidota bacterium]
MIPIRDTIKSKTIPFVNYAIITLCGAVFLYEVSLGARAGAFVSSLGVIPAAVSGSLFQGSFEFRPLMTLVTSMFLHGGWMHLLGNMLYLYIFGDNVEDRLGHFGYLVFYLTAGIGAGLSEVYFQQESSMPLIGASGAIAGVLGAYFLLFPRSRILTLIPLFVFFPVVEVSAFFFLGFWFLMQFLQGALSAGAGAAASGGVAWWAHAGGFVAGAALLPIFLLARRR